MKKLKYRAYHKKLKKMFNVHSLLWSGDRLCWAVLSDEKGFLYNDGEEVEIEYLEILQFTGLCDKKEKEIYEGDRFKSNDRVSPFIIVFFEGSFRGRYPGVTGPGFHYDSYEANRGEIIGNVFKNKDLLEQKP